MGLLRVLLAVAVLISHGIAFGAPTVDPLALLHPQAIMAVESFFIISGFYMEKLGFTSKIDFCAFSPPTGWFLCLRLCVPQFYILQIITVRLLTSG
jgi:peptidoglycan/LPS O-acetylase OafA/YrhL